MPDATLATFGLEGKQASELEQRRQAICSELQTKYPKGYEDPDIPMPLLTELSVITGALRSKTSKPPKPKARPKVEGKSPRATLDSLFGGDTP